MVTGISIKRLDGEVDRVRAFYELAGYKGGVQPGDLVIAAFAGDELVGVVRVAHEHGVLVARGMRVLPGFQRRGIGTRMLEELESILQDNGIAYAHLKGFYARIGLCRIDEGDAPSFLRERIEEYRGQRFGHEFVMLRKSRSIGVASAPPNLLS